MFDAIGFLETYGIKHARRGKHARPGWVQIECPLCTGHSGMHGGFNLSRGFYHCWRCRWHPLEDVISALLRCSWADARRVIGAHQTDEEVQPPQVVLPFAVSHVELPGVEMQPERKETMQHYRYLRGRGFNPDYLAATYDIRATTHVGSWKFRVVVPVYLDRRLVSFHTRDITGQSDTPHMACPMAWEVCHHKHTLYGLDLASADKAIVVEGYADAWRIGPGAVATFGTAFTMAQVRMLASRFETIGIAYDPEEEAQRQAEKLAFLLNGLGKETIIYDIDAEDPAEMSHDDVVTLRNDFFS